MPRGVKGSGPANVAPPPAAVLPVRHDAPLGSVNVDDLTGAELRIYARRAGVRPLDCEALTEDRLRQNTKLCIVNHFELLTED